MRVYSDRVSLIAKDGTEVVFGRGPMSPAAQARHATIVQELKAGWLDTNVGPALSPAQVQTTLPPDWRANLERLADGISGKTGRALVGVAILQASIKAISPDQSIRLTKGQPAPKIKSASKRKKRSASAAHFSWTEGLPMRGLSATYLVPFLRKHNLLALNRYGPFMTRGLAENYPYSPYYLADLQGPRAEWDALVEGLESRAVDGKEVFVYLCALLANRSNEFLKAAKTTLQSVDDYFRRKNRTFDDVLQAILAHIRGSMNPARPLEVALHSLLQALYWNVSGAPYTLRPLSQMRAANVKLGNVGDVELLDANGRPVEAWDSKMGFRSLAVELQEIDDKLKGNPTVGRAGFVAADRLPALDPAAHADIARILSSRGTTVQVVLLVDWARERIRLAGVDPDKTAASWLRAYAETLCQKRRDIAPLDEPSKPWVEGLARELDSR